MNFVHSTSNGKCVLKISFLFEMHAGLGVKQNQSKRQFEFFPRFFNATVGLSARSGTAGREIEFRSVSNLKLECLLFIVLQEIVCCMETLNIVLKVGTTFAEIFQCFLGETTYFLL